jgi:Tfp pilus assembly protein PilN
MRAVNLLPRNETGQGRKVPPVPVLVACGGAVVVTAVLALMFLSASSNVAKQRQALRDAQATYASIPAPPPKSPLVTELPQERQTRVTALSAALGQRVAWDRLLREVSQIVPSDVWLSTLTAAAPAVTPPAAPGAIGQEFIITGCTYSQPSVARFLARLDVVPDLQGISLTSSVSDGSDAAAGSAGASSGACPKGTVSFTMQGDLRHSGAAS